MRKTKTLALILSAGMLVSLLAGCGSSAKPADSAAPDNSAAPASAAPAANGKATVKFLHKYVSEPFPELFQSLCDEYTTANPNVTIKIETTTDDEIKDKLRVLMGSGDMPDIYQVWSGEYTKKFIRAGATLDRSIVQKKDFWNSVPLPKYRA